MNVNLNFGINKHNLSFNDIKVCKYLNYYKIKYDNK